MMLKFRKSFWKDTEGAVLAYTAILMPIFLGFIALGLDIAAWHIEKRQSQTIADAAAVAAAIERFREINEDDGEGDDCSNGSGIYTAAENAADENNFSTGAGQSLTLNCPPQLGEAAGVEGSVEAVVTVPLPLFLAALVNFDNTGAQASSFAVAGAGLGNSCIFALNESDRGAIDVNGGSNVQIGCGVRANSDSDQAIRLNGAGSCLEASDILVVGGTDNGNCYSPEPNTGVNPEADPLANLPEPANTGCDFNNRTMITGSQDATLDPGVYCNDVQIRTSGTVTFNPGIYIFDGAGLSVGASATVIADQVMIFFTNGNNANNFNLASGATWNQTAPSSGAYEGIAFYADRNDNSYNINFTGGANVNVEGIIYAPNQEVSFHGGSSSNESNTYIIADNITFTGQSFLTNVDDDGNPIFFNAFLIETQLVE